MCNSDITPMKKQIAYGNKRPTFWSIHPFVERGLKLGV
jgi:hypothetical protein